MQDWLRYSCQIALPDFDASSQQKLTDAKVLVVGLGGLGCPVSQYLTSSGIGTIGLADYDIVSEKNLHRQVLYNHKDVSTKKAISAAEKLQLQNPQVELITHDIKVAAENVIALIDSYDIIVDCTDNFETRYLLNDACVLSGKPLVYGAIYQYEGQVAIWNTKNDNGTYTPNYRDLYPDVNPAAVPNCSDGGVIPTIAGIIGLMQANEVIKYIASIGEQLAGKLFLFDARNMQSRVLKLGTISKTNITSLPTNIEVPEIDYTTIKNSLEDFTLIDVRSKEEHDEYNIGGLHIPLSEIEAVTFDATKPIVCYCASGVRSREAVKVLTSKYPSSTIYSLRGGISL